MKIKMTPQPSISLLSTYADFFNPAAEGVFFLDDSGFLIEANALGYEIFGFSADEVSELSFNKLCGGTNAEANCIPIHALSENQIIIHEQKLRRKNGSEFEAEIETRKLPDNLILSVIRDKTTFNKKQHALNGSEDHFRKFVELANEGVWSIDQDQRITYINPQVTKLLGYAPHEMMGKLASDFMFAEDMEDHARHVQIAISGAAEQYERRLKKKDGSALWVLLSITPEFDSDGRYQGSFGMATDITAQKRQENIQLARYQLMQYARTSTLDDLLQETLDKICFLTGSAIGFFHFLEADQKTISLQAWSTDTTKKFCQAIGKGLHYNIAEAGVWVDCIYEKKPVIHNDYAALVHKKGLPPGHAEVVRELVVPVFRDDAIVAILGVGNKSSDYDQNDVTLTATFADLAWDITYYKITEDSLKEKEKLLEESQKISHVGSYSIDIIKNTVIWSKETLRIFGLAENDPAPSVEAYQTFIHPNDVQRLFSLFDECLQTGKDFELTYQIIRKDGQVRSVYSVGKVNRDPVGQITGMTGTIQDITEKKQLEDNLFESEKRFRNMADTAPVLIWMSGKDRLCTYFNQTWLNFTGRTFQQELGEGWCEGVHPEDLDTCLTTYCSAFDLQQPFEMDYRLRCASGTYRWISDQGVPRFSAEGEFLGYIGTAYDITQRKQSEVALKRSEMLLNETQQLTKVGGWEYHVPTGIMAWSDEVYRIHGYEQGQAPNNSPELIPLSLACYKPEGRYRVKKAFDDCVQQGIPYELEVPFLTVQGEQKWVRTRGKAVLEKGNVIRVVGNLMDITSRKLDQIKLQASLVEKDVLIREVHHRVKNNLAAILGLLDLERQSTTDPTASVLLKELGNRIKSMSTVHEKLYRSENLSKIDFQDYLKSFVSHLRTSFNTTHDVISQVNAEGIELSLEYAVPCGLIVNELVTNALKHAFPNQKPGRVDEKICKIIVSMQEINSNYTLTVADNGVGLSEDVVWESSNSLGLRLFRMLGEHQLGGKITLDRSQGTQFTLTFTTEGKG